MSRPPVNESLVEKVQNFFPTEIVSALQENPLTNAIAAASVASPLWLTALTEVSTVAGLLMPILGASWLLIQMYTHIRKGKRK